MPNDMKERFVKGLLFRDFLDGVQENRDLWDRIFQQAHTPPIPSSMARQINRRWHLLAVVEDWCMDSANTLPWVSRLADSAQNLDLRVVRKGENPDLMENHLTDGSEAIPVFLILDQDFQEVDWWGPRPAGLKAFFQEELEDHPEEVRLAGLRGWYARDQGHGVLQELVALLGDL